MVVKDYQMFAVESQDDMVIVRLKDQKSLNFLVTTELQDELEDLLAAAKPAMLVVDFSDVATISSIVVGALLKARHVQQAAGREMCLARLSRRVMSVFQLLNLDDTLFKIVDNYETS